MKKFTKRVTAFFLAAIFIMSLAACGNSAGEQENKDDKGDAPIVGEQIQDGQTVYPCQVKDAKGNTITIEKEPERIVSVSPTLTEMVYALGGGDKIVGRSDYCDYPAEVLQVDSVGTIQNADTETLLSKNPDLILVSDMIDETFLEKLTSMNLTILMVEEERELEKVYDVMTMMGMILNCNEETKTCIDEMKNVVGEVQEKTEGLPMPKVYYVVDFGENGDYTVGGNTFVNEILTIAGGDNIAKEISGWEYTIEKIIENDPDVIIVPPYYEESFPTAPHYRELRAVKDGHVYSLDTNMIDRQGYRNAQAIRELAEIFHPEAFK